MLKRILMLLFILIIIIMTSITALVILIDPNGFRHIISEKVRDKTGYQLTINGDLRWHVWPQVSILTDSIILSKDGASKPILTADNMRLDVEIIPLFSKKLSIKNVLIKSTIINITDESDMTSDNQFNAQTTTINQIQSKPSLSEPLEQHRRWEFVLNRFMIANGTLVLQKNHDLITFRNINLTLDRKEDKIVAINLRGDINRNQKDLIYQLNANLDIRQYPENATLSISQLDYDYHGVGVPTGKLTGEISGTINYQPTPKIIESQNLHFSVNDNQFTGTIKTTLNKKNNTELTLNSEKIDLTPFLSTQTPKSDVASNIQQTKPVILENKEPTNELDFLNQFDAIFLLNAKKIHINQAVLSNLTLDAKNQDGITQLNQINFDINGGHIKADGIADGKKTHTFVKLNTTISNVDLGPFSYNFGINSDLKGLINANGYLSTDTIMAQNILRSLNGKLVISVDQARLEGINILDIIQHSLSQYTKNRSTSNNQLSYTELNEFLIDADIKNGNMQFSSLTASSNSLNLNGTGHLDMVKRNLDINLNVKIQDQNHDQNEMISKLKDIIIPVRLYGELSKLNYQIKIEQLIKELFTDKLQQKLDNLRERLKNNN